MKLRTVASGAARLVWGRLRGSNALSCVTVFPTLRCNCSCRYCDFPRHAGPELSTGRWLELLGALRQQGTFRLGVSGGEPLLREDFEMLAQEVNRLGFISSLVTNGMLLGERIAGARLFDFVLCTVEGGRAIHDRERGDGSFAAVVSGLDALRAAGHRRMGLICPVHADNQDDLEEPLRLAEGLGIRVFYQPTQIRAGWAGKAFEAMLCAPEERSAFSRIASWKRVGRPVGNSFEALALALEGDRSRIGKACLAGRYFHTLLPDGRLVACCMRPWDEAPVPFDPDHPAPCVSRLTKPDCQGCTILPYLETSMLLRLHPGAIWNAVRW